MKRNTQKNFKNLHYDHECRRKKNDVVDAFAKNNFKFLQNDEERWDIM